MNLWILVFICTLFHLSVSSFHLTQHKKIFSPHSLQSTRNNPKLTTRTEATTTRTEAKTDPYLQFSLQSFSWSGFCFDSKKMAEGGEESQLETDFAVSKLGFPSGFCLELNKNSDFEVGFESLKSGWLKFGGGGWQWILRRIGLEEEIESLLLNVMVCYG